MMLLVSYAYSVNKLRKRSSRQVLFEIMVQPVNNLSKIVCSLAHTIQDMSIDRIARSNAEGSS
jgi:hypothetical protein